MKEKRKHKRRHSIYYMNVSNKKTNQQAGRLVDITTEGMRLISKEPIDNNTVFQFQMDLPESVRNTNSITFDAVSVWSGKDINPDYYNTGFQFLKLSPENKEIIENPFENFLFRD